MDSMVSRLENEVDQSYICLETRLYGQLNRLLINLVSRLGRLAVCSRVSEKKWCSRLSEVGMTSKKIF